MAWCGLWIGVKERGKWEELRECRLPGRSGSETSPPSPTSPCPRPRYLAGKMSTPNPHLSTILPPSLSHFPLRVSGHSKMRHTLDAALSHLQVPSLPFQPL